VALIVSLPAHAQSRIDCNALNSRILKYPVHYCVYLPASYDASGRTKIPPHAIQSFIFFTDSATTNKRSSTAADGPCSTICTPATTIGDFLIVAPEGRRGFYINSADGSVRYSDFFLQEFIPLIESKYRVSSGRKNRAISGISMGGYGALRFAFSHPEMFSAVSAQSAALITESPEELDSAARSGAPLGKVLAAVFGNPINVSHWKNNSPSVLAQRNAAALRKMAIYFNCGQDDNYGFEKGAAALHDQLQKEGVKHEYRAYPGDHSLAYFLSHFEEVLIFHSQAFGLAQ
jgi:S-formylglutathione hydrolase FrmB